MKLRVEISFSEETLWFLKRLFRATEFAPGLAAEAESKPPSTFKPSLADESRLTVSTPEYLAEEELKDLARQQGWTPLGK